MTAPDPSEELDQMATERSQTLSAEEKAAMSGGMSAIAPAPPAGNGAPEL